MREAGQEYLPKHPAESSHAYKDRLETDVLINLTQIICDAWVGKPFSEPLDISDDVPTEIQNLFPNIDLAGNEFSVFLRQVFREGLLKSLVHVLVEYPRKNPRADGQPRTLEDDLNDNLRPYLVYVQPENLIFAAAENVNGVERLTQVRILETITTIPDGQWLEKVQNQVRVLTRGHCQIWKEYEDPNTHKKSYKLDDEWDYDLDVIPLVTFYTERTGLMTSRSPLIELGYLNVRHWQSESDQIAILTVTRFPMLSARGIVSDDQIVVGPNNILSVTDSQGGFSYVEHTGKAISAGRQELQDIEMFCAGYGAVFLQKRPGGASATARSLDDAAITSPLQDLARRFDDFVKQILNLIGAWIGIKPDAVGTVKVTSDFQFSDDDTAALQALLGTRQNKDLSRKYYLKALEQQEILPSDFDYADNDKQLLKEQAQDLKQQTKLLKVQASLAPKPAPAGPSGGSTPKEPEPEPKEPDDESSSEDN
jgi:Domain of unknown function (DUF4055)